jgi:hypothetical protein
MFIAHNALNERKTAGLHVSHSKIVFMISIKYGNRVYDTRFQALTSGSHRSNVTPTSQEAQAEIDRFVPKKTTHRTKNVHTT